jgi:hypothetical protein
VRGGVDPGRLQPIDDQVGGEVAAPGYHETGQPADRHILTFKGVEGRVGVIGRVQPIRGAVHDRVELTPYPERIAPLKVARVHPSGQFHEDRHLHRAGGMVPEQRLNLNLLPPPGVSERNGDGGGILGDPGPEQGFEPPGLLGSRPAQWKAGQNDDKARVSHSGKPFLIWMPRIRTT